MTHNFSGIGNFYMFVFKMMWFFFAKQTCSLNIWRVLSGGQGISLAPQCFGFIKTVQILQSGYCTYAYCDFDNISINCSALINMEARAF